MTKQGLIARRVTAQGYSDYIYEGSTDWLARETWHAVTSTNTFDLVRYWYANGRPSRAEIANVNPDLQSLSCNPNCYTTYYIQYNWHGDATAFTDASIGNINGGNNGWFAYDPWGNTTQPYPPATAAWDYYHWNGGRGYLYFSALGMYYIHGRWYRPDLGIFLSPDAKGEYLYGSGQDAINWMWEKLQGVGGCAIDFGSGAVTQFADDQTLGLLLGVSGYFGVEPRSNECIDTGRVTGRGGSEALSTYLTAQGIIDVGTGAFGGTLSLACEGATAGVCTPVAAVGGTTSLILVLKGAGETVYGGAVLKQIQDNPLYFAQRTGGGGGPYPRDMLVRDILKGKKGSIKNAPLEPGSPSWNEIQNMTWGQIEDGARRGDPGFKTIRKLLTQGEYNK